MPPNVHIGDNAARMDRPSLDQIAQTTEPQMVRQRFDEQNLVWAYVISWLFALSSFILIPFSFAGKQQRLAHIVSSLSDAVLAVIVIAAMIELRRARRRENWEPHAFARIIGRNLSGWLITFALVKFATLVFFALTEGSGWIAWGASFPTATIALRLLLPQRIILNTVMLAIIVAAILTAPNGKKQKNMAGVFTMLATINIVCFVWGAITSRGIRNAAIEEGVQRRTEAREQMRIRDELRFAREVQVSMLPEAPPQLEWADVSGISLPATEVGGDYYDYFVVDGRLAIVCGDVAGHGLASGITLSALRSGFTCCAMSCSIPLTCSTVCRK